MSNLCLNVRFCWYWHLQIERYFPYRPAIRFNRYLWGRRRFDRVSFAQWCR